MIIKMHQRGRSFKALVDYLSHDKDKAETAERLAWTHTVNLTNDHIPSALNEMIWVYRSADQLKRAAGISTSGSKLDHPVKHFSLSWHESESPTRDEMIDVTMRYMKHMGMDDRQAILFAHNDTAHPHVHIVVNMVSPEDGRALKTSYEHRRSQAFALAYEQERGLVFCDERLKKTGEREKSLTRPMNESLKEGAKAFERDERERLVKPLDYSQRRDNKKLNSNEWTALKAHQKAEREQFIASGKTAFRDAGKAAYREVRQGFRGQWSALYAARRSGSDREELASIKADLLEAQKKALDERRDAVTEKLREERDKAYEAILKQQQVDRDELRKQQARGERTHRIFDVIYPAPIREEPRPAAWSLKQKHIDQTQMRDEFEAATRTTDPRYDAVERQRTVARMEKDVSNTKRAGKDADKQRPAPTVEMTDRRVEAKRSEQAREMTDAAQGKQKDEGHAILRASWNRHRSRGRGD